MEATFISKRSSANMTTASSDRSYKLIVIGVSTGGPNALLKILSGLKKVRVPIVIIQHIAGNFPEMMVESMARVTPIPVKVAKEGEPLLPNNIYLSDSNKHLQLVKIKEQTKINYYFHYSKSAPVKSCRPSVDVFFDSVAQNFEDRILAFIGTGMGNDGEDGVRSIKAMKQRNVVVCQDEASSVVYGMNRCVIEAGMADKVLPLEQISGYFNSLVGAL